MFGYPGHHAANWRTTLDAALALEPEHVSAYGFIPEDGTPLGDAILGGSAAMVPPELEAELYAQADERFALGGLMPYETSNWSRPGAESRHNLTYWLRRDYLALGPSSHGLWQGVRYANARSLGDWAARLERSEDPASERETVSEAARAEETIMLGLRLASGLDPGDLPALERAQLTARYGAALEAAVAEGRLVRCSGRYCIPATQRFVADDTIAWLAVRARPLESVEAAA